MTIARQIRLRIAGSQLLRFNRNNRDAWISAQASRVRPGAFVLDIGAGTCPYRTLFSHTHYKTQDFAQLDPVKNRDAAGYGAIDYVCEITTIPLPDASVDVILCTEVIEHVPDPMAVIRECARLLKPGGTLILTAPLGSGLHQEPYHFYGGFTPHWYRKVLPAAGLDIDELSANGDTFLHYGQFGQYVVARLAPWRVPPWAALFVLPVWLIALPLIGLIVPILAHLARFIARDEAFAVGYHVRARRRAM